MGQFDEAFMSRIHLSLGYEKLDDEARKKIWDNLFRKLNEDHQRGAPEIKYDYDAKNYVKTKEVQSLEWNGREIRNGGSESPHVSYSLLTNNSFPDCRGTSGLRLEAEEDGKTARDDRGSPEAGSVYVVGLQELHEGYARWNGRLDTGL